MSVYMESGQTPEEFKGIVTRDYTVNVNTMWQEHLAKKKATYFYTFLVLLTHNFKDILLNKTLMLYLLHNFPFN
jgi:hypothetical protein